MERNRLLLCLPWRRHLRSALELLWGAQLRDRSPSPSTCLLLPPPWAPPGWLKHPPHDLPCLVLPALLLVSWYWPWGLFTPWPGKGGLCSVQPWGSCSHHPLPWIWDPFSLGSETLLQSLGP